MPSARGRYSAEFQITAQTEGLKRGFAQAQREQERFLGVSRRGWQQFARAAAVGATAAAAAVLGFGAAGLSAAGEIATLQRQTNLSAEEASRWRLAMRGAGGDLTDVEDILRTLNSRVIEFAKGETTATDAFAALGARVSDFDLTDPNQQLETFLALLERAPHSAAQFAADELIGDTAKIALQLAATRREADLLNQSFGGQIADIAEIESHWRLISGFAAAASESVGVAFLRGLTDGVGSSEELAAVLRDDVLPVVRTIEDTFERIGNLVGYIGSTLETIKRGFGDLDRGGDLVLPDGTVFRPTGGGRFERTDQEPQPAPVRRREPDGSDSQLVVTPRDIRTTPLHRRTRAISDRAIEGERLAEARLRALRASLEPGPGDDPRQRLAQATPDFQSRLARQQDLAQQAWWSAFWQNTGRSLQQGLTQSIGGAVSGFVSGPEAGSLKALGDSLLQALSATFARAFAQSLVDATVGRALTGVFSTAFAGAGAGTTAPITGFYHEGGVVPGPVGRPQAAIVHGGETVFTPEQLQVLGRGGGGDTYVFNLADVVQQSEEAVNGMLDRIVAVVNRDRYERNLDG